MPRHPRPCLIDYLSVPRLPQGDREANLVLRREQTLLSEHVADMETEKNKEASQCGRLQRENEQLNKRLQGAPPPSTPPPLPFLFRSTCNTYLRQP